MELVKTLYVCVKFSNNKKETLKIELGTGTASVLTNRICLLGFWEV